MDAELLLINKVELRIALASTSSQFEASLNSYLAPLLLKLASPHAPVRLQIFQTIHHLLTRINADPLLQLPVKSLLAQVKAPSVPQGVDAHAVRIYSLLFLSRGIDRLDSEQEAELLPLMVQNLAAFENPVVTARVFHCVCKLLLSLPPPLRGSSEADQWRKALFHANPEDEALLCQHLTNLFLLLPTPVGAQGAYPCAGLSSEEVSFLTSDAAVTFTAELLTEYRRKILGYVSSGCFDDVHIQILVLIGTADTSSTINDLADTVIRKVTIGYENPAVVERIFRLFCGDATHSAVRTTIQARLLAVMCQSKLAAQHPAMARVSAIGLHSEYVKVKQGTVAFVKWVAQSCGETPLADFATMAAQLKQNLVMEGWPRMDPSMENHAALLQRRIQYEALGSLLRRQPALLTQNSLLNLGFLFDSLAGDTPELRPTIQDSLSKLTVHLSGLNAPLKAVLKTMLSANLARRPSVDEAALRYMTIKYINCAFPFTDAEARMLCVLGCAKENRLDIVEEAVKGLHPYWFNMTQAANPFELQPTAALLSTSVKFPSFAALVSALLDQAREANPSLPLCMDRALGFAFQVLVMEAIEGHSTVVVGDEEWETRLNKALEFDERVNELVRAALVGCEAAAAPAPSPLQLYMALLVSEFVGEGIAVGSGLVPFGQMLVKLVSLSLEAAVGSLVADLPRLERTRAAHPEVADLAAHVIAIVASHPGYTDTQVAAYLAALEAAGSNAAMGSLVARLSLRKRPCDGMVLQRLLDRLFEGLDDPRQVEGCLEVIGVLAVYGIPTVVTAPPSTPGEVDGGVPLGTDMGMDLDAFWGRCVDRIEPWVRKCHEKATLTWAYLSVAIDANTERFERVLFATFDTTQTEYLFASGEALAIVGAAWSATVLAQKLDVAGGAPRVARGAARLPPILAEVIRACLQPRPRLRRAGCIWLLSLVQFCGHLPAIQERALEIHRVFQQFLGDREEVVQEAASRGLSIIYERGDRELRDTLVRGLLSSLADPGRAAGGAGTVEHDTQLFAPGAMPTGDGSVSTYKDILNLAVEVGDPSLVYKFMSLAQTSALWASRRGIAFGLGSILSKAALDDLLVRNTALAARLIPKLYRYRFDPSLAVQRSMNDIWHSLVKDTGRMVKANRNALLQHLLESMGHGEWRVRQAATSALVELLQTAPVVEEPRLAEIWTMAFRAADDVKESVRKEASRLTRGLAAMAVRRAEQGTAVSARAALATLIPFLLGRQGLLGDAEEGRSFALETLLKLCLTGKAILPFAPALLEEMIVLMSLLEPLIVNYVALNADQYNVKTLDLDARRLQSVGHSPIIEALERLLDGVSADAAGMEPAANAIITGIKRSLGLPSKAAGSRLLTTLVVKHPFASKPFGDALLKTAVLQLSDPNATIAAAYATAAGYLCRIASNEQVLKVAAKIQKMYFSSTDGDARARMVAGITSEAVSRHSGDRFASLAVDFLPLAFVAQHDPDLSVSAPFTREWADNSSGTATVRLYLLEILALVEENLSSQQYLIRAVVSRAIAGVCTSFTDKAFDASAAASAQTARLFAVLLEACKGRSWDGKQYILQALVMLVLKFQLYVEASPLLSEAIGQTMVTEAKRKNRAYARHALQSLGRYIGAAPPSLGIMEEYLQLITEAFDDSYYEDDSDMEEAETNPSSQQNLKREEARIALLSSLVEAFSVSRAGDIHPPLLTVVLTALTQVFESTVVIATWRSQLAAVEGLQVVAQRILKQPHHVLLLEANVEAFCQVWLVLLAVAGANRDIENVRGQFFKATASLVKVLTPKHTLILPNMALDFKTRVDEAVRQALTHESSSLVRHELEKLQREMELE